MGSAIGDFWIVLKHELTSCRRNMPFIIYSLTFPLFIVLLALIVNIPALNKSSQKPAVAIVAPENAADAFAQERNSLIASIRANPRLKVVDSTDPAADLRESKIDGVISFNRDQPSMELSVRESLPEFTRDKIESALKQDRETLLLSLPPLQKTGRSFLTAFHVEERSVGYSTGGMVEIVIILVGLMMFHLASSMSSATQAVWAEETRTKAILNVLMLPVHRIAYVTAKAMVMTILAILSVFAYQFALLLCGAVIALSVQGDPSALTTSTAGATNAPHAVAHHAEQIEAMNMFAGVVAMPWLQFFVCTFASFLIFGYFCAGVCLMCVAVLKPKIVSGWLGWLMTGVASPVFVAFDPAIVLSEQTMLIPVLNLLLTMKSALLGTLIPYQAVVALTEMLVIGAIIGYYGARLLGSDRFFLNTLDW